MLDAEVVDGRASPTPIRVVLLGRTQVVGMTMVPAGSETVDGTLTKVLPLFQGVQAVDPVKQFMLVLVEFSPRASITAPLAGYDNPLRMPYSVEQKFVEANMLASMKAPEPLQQVPEEPDW